jgi:N-methylhydantoinase B
VLEVLKKNTILTIQDGKRVATSNPGGGGWGKAHERDPQQVAADVRNGFVSLQAARDEYGVAIDPVDFAVQDEATRKLRAVHD